MGKVDKCGEVLRWRGKAEGKSPMCSGVCLCMVADVQITAEDW